MGRAGHTVDNLQEIMAIMSISCTPILLNTARFHVAYFTADIGVALEEGFLKRT